MSDEAKLKEDLTYFSAGMLRAMVFTDLALIKAAAVMGSGDVKEQAEQHLIAVMTELMMRVPGSHILTDGTFKADDEEWRVMARSSPECPDTAYGKWSCDHCESTLAIAVAWCIRNPSVRVYHCYKCGYRFHGKEPARTIIPVKSLDDTQEIVIPIGGAGDGKP